MDEQQQGAISAPEERTLVCGRFTSHDGLRGWLQARVASSPLYGEGLIEIRSQEVILRGWHRSWLGLAEGIDLAIAIDDVSDVMTDGRIVRFVQTRRVGVPRQIEFHAVSIEDAQWLGSQLPRVRSSQFERWRALGALNDRIKAVGNHSWVTPALAALNVVVFVAMMVAAGGFGTVEWLRLVGLGSNFGPLTLHGEWWRLLTSLFLHGNLVHLLLNVWVFWGVGRLCERLYGSGPYTLIFFGCGVLAGLTRVVWDPGVPSIGASGAIFGVIGAFVAFALHSHQQIMVSIPRSTWLSTVVFALYSLVSGWVTPGIDNAAHVGGLVSGVILGWIMTRPLDVELRKPLPIRQSAAVVSLVALSALGAWWQAGGAGGRATAIERYFRAHDWYVNGELKNLHTWNELSVRSRAGSISNVELGSRFENEILPFWDQAAKRLHAEESTLPADQRVLQALVTKAVRLRQEWVHALIASATDQGSEHAAEVSRLAVEVDKTVARLERLGVLARLAHRPSALANAPLVTSLRDWFSARKSVCVDEPAFLGRIPGAHDLISDGPQSRRTAGCLAQRLFQSGKYRELDDFIGRAGKSIGDLPDGGSTLDGIFAGLSDLIDYGGVDSFELLGRTSDWRREMPGSVNPVLTESMIFDAGAWAVRGHGGANSVSPQAWKIFAYRVEMAAASLEEIADRAVANPVWYSLSLSVGLDQSKTAGELREIFNRGVATAPTYRPLYARMLRILMPRWLGSPEEVGSFIDSQTDRPIEPDFMLYARLYWSYSSLERDEVELFQHPLAHWAIMETGFDRLVARYPKSDYILNAYAKFACMARDADKYNELRPKLQGRVSTVAWSDKVSLSSCDARFQVRES
jgi:rhomboid protease GluP